MIFDFAGWLYILILLGGLAMIFYPLAHWMHEKEGKWWPWPKHKRKSETLKSLPPRGKVAPQGRMRGKPFNTAILISVYPRFGGVFVLRQIM